MHVHCVRGNLLLYGMCVMSMVWLSCSVHEGIIESLLHPCRWATEARGKRAVTSCHRKCAVSTPASVVHVHGS